MKDWRLLLLLPAWLLLTAAGFNPADYGSRYTTGASAAASGVIATTRSALTGCEIQNSGGSGQYYLFFDSATVPANGTGGYDSSHTSGWKMWTFCSASTTCFWGASGPTTGGSGAAVVFNNGISWSNSSAFPTKTLGSADSEVACSFQQ